MSGASNDRNGGLPEPRNTEERQDERGDHCEHDHTDEGRGEVVGQGHSRSLPKA